MIIAIVVVGKLYLMNVLRLPLDFLCLTTFNFVEWSGVYSVNICLL